MPRLPVRRETGHVGNLGSDPKSPAKIDQGMTFLAVKPEPGVMAACRPLKSRRKWSLPEPSWRQYAYRLGRIARARIFGMRCLRSYRPRSLHRLDDAGRIDVYRVVVTRSVAVLSRLSDHRAIHVGICGSTRAGLWPKHVNAPPHRGGRRRGVVGDYTQHPSSTGAAHQERADDSPLGGQTCHWQVCRRREPFTM
jgi:hypothetical protein